MISPALIGLSIISLAWIIQFFTMNKTKKISPIFVGLYSLGVAMLVYEGFKVTLNAMAVANLISFVVSILVLIKVLKK